MQELANHGRMRIAPSFPSPQKNNIKTMSGGHFQYQQHRIEDIAVEIDEMIRENNYPPEILAKFREAAHTLRQAAEMAQRVDWLVSGDDGEESFMRRWHKEVRPYYANAGDHRQLPK